METKLYVGNLAYSTTDEDLRLLFAQAGMVKDVMVLKDRDTGRSKGFGFVEMTTQAEAQKAISLFHGKVVNDRELMVNIARPREETDRRGGSFNNKRSGGNRDRDRRGGQRRY
jgi:RNA recognition motif-containing protein